MRTRTLFAGLFILVLLPFSRLHAQDVGDATTAESSAVFNTEATLGDIVKTDESSAVYYWAEDGDRYAFPNENVYFSWYSDFDAVKEISAEDMASIDFGGLVDYQAGTSLVKIPSVPTVYAVEPDGLLRPLSSEEDAAALYGDDWASQIDDLSEAFFPQYTVADTINVTGGELPEGYLMQNDEGDVCRVDSTGSCVEVDDAISEDLESLYEEFAEDFDAVAARMDELFGAEVMFETFDPALLENILAELAASLDPVFIEESLRIAEEMSALYELDAYAEYEEDDTGEDDADEDGMKDYWDDLYEEWLLTGPTDEDGDGVDDWWEAYYTEWVDEGYDDYYNEYYDYYSESDEAAEYDYEEWSDYFGDTSDWSYDDEGFYYTDEGGEDYYYDESSGESYVYDDEGAEESSDGIDDDAEEYGDDDDGYDDDDSYDEADSASESDESGESSESSTESESSESSDSGSSDSSSTSESYSY